MYVAFTLLLLLSSIGFADCSSPAGAEGAMRYDAVQKIPVFCDGTAWKSMNPPKYAKITTANAIPIGETAWAYSAYQACPAGHTLEFFGLSTKNAGTSSNYHYCTCQASGNSLRAGVFGIANANYHCRCQGLCVKP